MWKSPLPSRALERHLTLSNSSLLAKRMCGQRGWLFFRGNPYRDALDSAVGFLAKRKNRAVSTFSRKNHFTDLFPCLIKYVLDLQYLLVIKVRVVGKDRAGNFPDAPADPGK